ncbi:MAG: hypothetical protein ABIF77_12545 [bacterium]
MLNHILCLRIWIAVGFLASFILPMSLAPQVGATPGSLMEIGHLFRPTSTSVAAEDSLVVIGTSRGLLVQDLSQIEQPETVFEVDLGDTVQVVGLYGDLVLATLDDATRWLVDFGGGGEPTITQVVADYAFPNLWHQGTEYVVIAEAGEIRIYEYPLDGDDPVGAVAVAGDFLQLIVEDDVAYLLTAMPSTVPGWPLPVPEVLAISLADPSAPVEVGGYAPPEAAAQNREMYCLLAVQGGVAHLIGTSQYLQSHYILRCVDFSDPSAPVSMASQSLCQNALDIQVTDDGRLAVIQCGNMLRVYDVSAPPPITLLGEYAFFQTELRDYQLYDHYALCIDNTALQILECHAELNSPPTNLGYTYTPLHGQNLAVDNSAVYLVDQVLIEMGGGLPWPSRFVVTTTDISEPAHPEVRHSFTVGDISWHDPARMWAEVHAGILYVLSYEDELVRLDLANPLEPQYVDRWLPGLEKISSVTLFRVSGHRCPRRRNRVLRHRRSVGSSSAGKSCDSLQLRLGSLAW